MVTSILGRHVSRTLSVLHQKDEVDEDGVEEELQDEASLETSEASCHSITAGIRIEVGRCALGEGTDHSGVDTADKAEEVRWTKANELRWNFEKTHEEVVQWKSEGRCGTIEESLDCAGQLVREMVPRCDLSADESGRNDDAGEWKWPGERPAVVFIALPDMQAA